MGCGSTRTINDEYYLGPTKIILNLSKVSTSPSLEQANSIISSIVKLRNRILIIYHKLIYKTGACVFVHPTIAHCTHCAFYKISTEFKGHIQEANFTYTEDPPYIKILANSNISKESKLVLNVLFDFIIELRSYKALIKQIDKDTPELLYLVHENPNNLSEENISKINMGMEIFKKIGRFRNDVLQQYKEEIYNFITKTDSYSERIDAIGKIANSKKLSDIYQICMLYKDYKKKNIENDDLMFNTIEEAKKNIQAIIDSDKKEDDFLLSSVSISSRNNDDPNDTINNI